jgi:nitroimidazol reductase NimA-like FMN-containing flavoprotein (pyridoxamine 5'-phosphate oxidase superfamily)
MPGYGIQAIGDGLSLIPWEGVDKMLSKARNYWISTTRPDGRPHAVPVWAVWREGAFFFGTGKPSQKEGNIKNNPWLVVHLESGNEVVIIQGRVEHIADPDLFASIADVYSVKYDWSPLEGLEGD